MPRATARRRPLTVELVGPAGAGKSTVLECLKDRLPLCPGSVWGLPTPLLLASAVGLLPTVVGLCRQARSFRWSEIKQLIRLRALYRLLARPPADPDRVVVLDEGPVFVLSWLLVFGHPSVRNGALHGWWQRTLRDWADVIDVVILLDAPDPVLARRIRQRAKPLSVRDKGDRDIFAFSASFRAAFERVLAALRAEGGPRVLSLAGDAPAAETAARVLAALTDPNHGR